MIEEICRVAVCLALGDAIAHVLAIAVPAAVIGLVLLFVHLCHRGRVSDALGTMANRMLEMYGLFFVPAGVGIIVFPRASGAEAMAMILAVSVGTLVTIVCTGIAAAAIVGAERRTEGGMSWAKARS